MIKETILLPVKPKFSSKILDQSKVWEYRKVLPKNKVSHIVLYSSSPEKKIRAIIEVESILSGNPASIWSQTKESSGISKEYFNTYFAGRDKAHAFKLGKITPLRPLDPKAVNVKIPQSFCYLDSRSVDSIMKFRQRRVFIGGVHGVGKSTLIKAIKGKLLDYEHLICSEVIKYTQSKLNVKKIDRNQDVLVSGIENIAPSAKTLLIDGHFALLQRQKPTLVPLSTFNKLKVDAILLLQGAIRTVLDRLPLEMRQLFDESILSELQELEVKHAHFVSRELNIPMLVVDAFNYNEAQIANFLDGYQVG